MNGDTIVLDDETMRDKSPDTTQDDADRILSETEGPGTPGNLTLQEEGPEVLAPVGSADGLSHGHGTSGSEGIASPDVPQADHE